MNIAWMYLDKRNAVINALKDYESMNYIVDNSPSKICETEEQMIGQSSPSFSDMPKGSPNPKAAENRIVQAIDTITIMNERYQRALEYMTWFQPAWQALSADERFVLSRFYMDDSFPFSSFFSFSSALFAFSIILLFSRAVSI